MAKESEQDPLAAGASLALLAAVMFGVTTPVIKHFGADVGPFATATLLYGGAALASVRGRSDREAPVRWIHARRLVAVALLGAVAAPVCLAWALHRTSATTASLLLNCEAVFTVLLARVVFAEPIGKRVALAVGLMVAGGALLVVGSGRLDLGGGLGAIAVLTASLAWASDNTLTKPLADLDPSRVVVWKGAIGASLSAAVALVLREPLPGATNAMALGACGAVGYGASLRLYLRAQRQIGAGRTGSIFAVAPFIGAVMARVMGDRGGGALEIAAAAFFLTAVYLHLTEKHRHVHKHIALEHEHAHRHDDGHHSHPHDESPDGEHTHRHRHEPTTHAHPHGPDTHHRHSH